jgi:glycosyltransferase involved in cell wall biosynthesis
MHGYLKKKELNELFHESSIYVMTSYTESFGIVLIEAMSHGIPCIAFTSAEGANDLITNDYNGYLIPNRDFNKMIEKIEELTNNKKLRKELGKNAREFSLKYSSDNIKKEWLELLKRRG